ncbi:hypothetical protein KAU88_09985, partial [Candidatus Bathyarchaeota archaeon]|nr:hypothetical protein [Candidatus Bathyarchaeota archaeon]
SFPLFPCCSVRLCIFSPVSLALLGSKYYTAKTSFKIMLRLNGETIKKNYLEESNKVYLITCRVMNW